MKHFFVLSSLVMLMAYFTCTLSAPTISSLSAMTTDKQDDETLTTTMSNFPLDSIKIEISTMRNPSTLEKSPTRESSTETPREMLKIKLPMTATPATESSSFTVGGRASLIGSSVTEAVPKAKTMLENNEMIKIHESETSKVPLTTLTSHLMSELPSTMEIERKSINSMSTPVAIASNFETIVENESSQSQMKMPINVDVADNLKIIEEDVRAPHNNIQPKKGKEKDSKKKALKAQQTDKKQKLKQKLFMDMNYSTTASIPLQPQLPHTSSDVSTDELHETTTAISTSIKTAPTTIKSTTLTMTTMTSSSVAPIVTTTSSESTLENLQEDTTIVHESNKDNFIVLNSNSSGLIVVDVMESFGKEASVTSNSFEIKMDLIDETASTTPTPSLSTAKDDIFTTTIELPSTSAIVSGDTNKKSSQNTANDDIILINESTSTTQATTLSTQSTIKWNELGQTDDLKITFDNIDLPHQNVNVSIENGELIIDSIDISILNRAEEELRKKANATNGVAAKNNSLEIVLVEDDNSHPNVSCNEETTIAAQEETTIHFDMAAKKIEMGSGNGDDIKIKTTDKDSDTIFYISNTEVKVIESIPTSSPSDASDITQVRKPTIYEEDVIVDVPKEKSRLNETPLSPIERDKYEEDIVLSPLTSGFDPKDINYIGEAFLDVEESANGAEISENRHIIPLTSDVVIQPVELKDLPNIPIIGEPPQIELEEMMFSDDYDNKPQQKNLQQHVNYQMEDSSLFPLNNRLLKNELQADVPHDIILDTNNSTLLSAVAVAPNKTHISVNTVINGTNMTTTASPLENATAAMSIETDEMADNSDLNDIQTLLVACLLTLAPLFLCVIIALAIRYCWQKYRNHDGGSDLISDKSTDPLAEKHIGGSTDEMKSTESAMTLNRSNGNVSTELLLANANGDVLPNNNHNDSNGSIIKMTMKNNHLIVETEERNDISRDTRETKMHYSPSEKDGVFIVEAARGADQNGSHKPSPLLQKPTEAPLEIPEEIKLDTLQSHFTPSSPEEERKQNSKPEQVEVHTPPAEIKAEEPTAVITKETEQVICNGAKTGLTSSDLSLTSSNSSNQNYTYGDRESYNYEEKGYRGSSPKRIINIHCHDLKPVIENSPPAPQTTDANKPVITSAIYKNDSQDEVEQLKSDMMAIEENNNVNGTNGMNGVKDTSEVTKIHGKMNGLVPSAMKTNGLDEIIAVPDENCNDTVALKSVDCNGDITMDSLSYLPAPPPEDLTHDDLTSMDSFPPPPPLENDSTMAQS